MVFLLGVYDHARLHVKFYIFFTKLLLYLVISIERNIFRCCRDLFSSSLLRLCHYVQGENLFISSGVWTSSFVTSSFPSPLYLLQHMPTYMLYISELSVIKYALEAVVVAVYERGRTDIYCPSQYIYCHYSKSEVIRRDLMMEGDTYLWCMSKIIIQLLFFKTLAYFTLQRRLRKGEAK